MEDAGRDSRTGYRRGRQDWEISIETDNYSLLRTSGRTGTSHKDIFYSMARLRELCGDTGLGMRRNPPHTLRGNT